MFEKRYPNPFTFCLIIIFFFFFCIQPLSAYCVLEHVCLDYTLFYGGVQKPFNTWIIVYSTGIQYYITTFLYFILWHARKWIYNQLIYIVLKLVSKNNICTSIRKRVWIFIPIIISVIVLSNIWRFNIKIEYNNVVHYVNILLSNKMSVLILQE